LGDGYIVTVKRGVYWLRVYCDSRHTEIALDIVGTLDVLTPGKLTSFYPHPRENLVTVSSHWKHWPCLFPQHGPGRKHEREIVLTRWQERIVDAEPEQFVRGLIHSDGCRSINRIRYRDWSYDYPRYEFANESTDIRDLFCQACDRIGVEWRQMNRNTISVNKRAHVARLDEFIGPKS